MIPPKTRSLDRKIIWPKLIREFEKNGQKFRIRPIDAADIAPVAAFFKKHSPYFLGSIRQNLFDEEFYRKEVAVTSRWEEDSKNKLYFFGVLESLPEEKMIMAFGCVRDAFDLMVQNMNVTLDPDFRGQNISIEYATYLNDLWEESGADYVYGFMSTRHVLSQKIFLKLGAKFGGVLPGIFRRTFDGKNYYRDTELFIYKFFNGAEDYLSDLKDCQVVPELKADIEDLLRKMSDEK